MKAVVTGISILLSSCFYDSDQATPPAPSEQKSEGIHGVVAYQSRMGEGETDFNVYVYFDEKGLSKTRMGRSALEQTDGPPSPISKCKWGRYCIFESDDGLPIIIPLNFNASTINFDLYFVERTSNSDGKCSSFRVGYLRERRPDAGEYKKEYTYCNAYGITEIRYLDGSGEILTLSSLVGLGAP